MQWWQIQGLHRLEACRSGLSCAGGLLQGSDRGKRAPTKPKQNVRRSQLGHAGCSEMRPGPLGSSRLQRDPKRETRMACGHCCRPRKKGHDIGKQHGGTSAGTEERSRFRRGLAREARATESPAPLGRCGIVRKGTFILRAERGRRRDGEEHHRKNRGTNI